MKSTQLFQHIFPPKLIFSRWNLKKNNPKKDPNGGKWSLAGVLNPALSNKSNYSQYFKLMDPTEECNLAFPVNHHLFFPPNTSCDTSVQRSPPAGRPLEQLKQLDTSATCTMLLNMPWVDRQHLALVIQAKSEEHNNLLKQFWKVSRAHAPKKGY